ncbi:MAG: helix-turn-helix domain-containing protein [Microbacteriaceae bacterium]
MASAGDLERSQRIAFGARVRELRQAKGFSQEGFAHHVGLDRTYVGGIERGERNVSLDNIHRLAEALGVSPADFFD